MTIYAVFNKDATGVPAVVPERFSWFAALLPPIYALAHGLVLELALYVIALVLLSLSAAAIGGAAAFWIYVVFAVAIGFEAGTLRRAALRHQGWQFRSHVVAASADLARLEGLRATRR
jgi:hypothetical protein